MTQMLDMKLIVIFFNLVNNYIQEEPYYVLTMNKIILGSVVLNDLFLILI